jgi:hypothetical protein
MFTTYYSGDQIEKNEGDVQTGFWWGNLRVRSHLEDSSVNGRIIFSWTFGNGMGVHGLDLAGRG